MPHHRQYIHSGVKIQSLISLWFRRITAENGVGDRDAAKHLLLMLLSYGSADVQSLVYEYIEVRYIFATQCFITEQESR